MAVSFVPSIAPNGQDQTVYLVINNYGKSGTAFAETDVADADLETVISDLMSGQYSDPVRVVAFNTAEHWAEDCPLRSPRRRAAGCGVREPPAGPGRPA